MSEEQKLRQRISQMQFASWELHLFLDTHPENKEADMKYREYQAKADALMKEFEEKYGPIKMSAENMDRWAWVNDPWPWETEGNE